MANNLERIAIYAVVPERTGNRTSVHVEDRRGERPHGGDEAARHDLCSRYPDMSNAQNAGTTCAREI